MLRVHSRRFFAAAAVALCAVAAPSTLHGQSAPDSAAARAAARDSLFTVELVGIEVLGRRDDALARFPGSARVVRAQEIRGRQPLSANEILRSVPGVHVQEEEGLGLRANIGIRGLDPDRSRAVLVLEDGVPVALAPYGEPELYYSPPIERMERLEIVKGSGSILFGPQTIGGVINYVTPDAPRSPWGEVLLRGGSASQLLRARYGGTWDNTRGSMTVFRRTTDGLAGLVSNTADVTGKIGFTTARASTGVKLSVYDESSNSTYVGLTDSLFRADPYAHPSPSDRLWIRRYALTGSHELALGTTATLRTNAYAYQTSRDWMRRNYTYNTTRNSLVFQDATGNRNRAFEVAGIEPRLHAAMLVAGVPNTVEAGFRLHHETARDQFIQGRTATSRTGDVRDDELRTGRALAAFAQNRIALTDALHVIPGLRAERFEHDRRILRTRVRRTNGTTTTNLPEDVDIRTHDVVSALIPGIGVAYAATEAVTLFGGVHRGFAPPRTKDALIYENPVLDPNDQVPALRSLDLDAEHSRNYEMGIRARPAGFLEVELTGFHLDFANQIIEPSLSAGSVAQAALANQGRTRHSGFEAGASWDLGTLMRRSFTLVAEANYTFVHAIFSADRLIAAPSGDTVNVKGNRLPYAPQHRINGALAYATPNALELRVDASWIDEQFSDLFETRDGSANGRVGLIPSYHVVDLSARYHLPTRRAIALTGAVKNATNQRYIASRRPEGIKPGIPQLFTVGIVAGF